MNIGGLIRNSLIDFPGRPTVVVFTQGCNWRCPYCHNAALIPLHGVNQIAPDAVFAVLDQRPATARSLVVTGGEPTLQPGLISFLQEAKRRCVTVKLDSNGSRPMTLREIIQAELVDYIALDVKGPLARYPKYCGKRVTLAALRESIHLVMLSGVDYEFRTTVVPALHSVDDIAAVGHELAGGRHLYLQPFRSEQTLRPKLLGSDEPSRAFLESCAERARRWIPTTIRI
ncbi:anaerobic ribonucleoside-triphosphate reductase activating protein [Cerasicoccus arenae]|uniref:Anaerobic ribonucleoside-triphosphate reductase activating protein n=1 Tax=Cerasicoccus arenae TaxID=424488 RepID=A0A8J3DK22_9BACT|nr:anaerobic ribonucleoside-triphosphate reductase activating protein [Cerasicoccus arenae]MBK1858414.1 anaerobic ribonucleoside-triphosphate reductase activating protein [Cerasicoccus arenae]GHC02397.1 anaerobic ribonucleoside-triphosphate reductase activating protein [Cerasicoccus arenae]